jgi:signal peptidase I
MGVLMALFLDGSAHFVTGRRTTGVTWHLSLLVLLVLGVLLIAIPGTAPLFVGASLLLISAAAWIVMLVTSYRPIPPLGIKGWLAFLALLVLIEIGEDVVVFNFFQFSSTFSGAMQPTINGVQVEPWSNGEDRARPSFADLVLRGEKHHEIHARNSGTLSGSTRKRNEYRVGWEYFELPHFARPFVSTGSTVREGDLLWAGVSRAGDHLLLDKVTYRISKPKRGDIVVFRTDSLRHRQIRPGDFYVKRIAGLPGERVGIQPPDLLINGEPVRHPPIFRVIASAQDGYRGFVTADPQARDAYLSSTNDVVDLGKGEYFVLGDNTHHSMDSRYHGPIKRSAIVGKVTRVYWPFDRIKALDPMR